MNSSFFNSSFLLVFFIPVLLFIFIKKLLPEIRKNIKYRIKKSNEQTGSNIEKNETQLLTLEYNGQNLFALRCGAIVALGTALIAFFGTAIAAREDMYRTFFFLNRVQTYILYYWTWKFFCLFMFIWGASMFAVVFNKKLVFFRNRIIAQNSLTGTKEFFISKDVWLVKSPRQDAYWLYNELQGTKIQILNRDLMKLDPQQETRLAEFISRIPEKEKTFWS